MERTIQKRVDVDGSWISVDVYGDTDAPAIILIPGVLADAEAWGPVARRLEGWPTVAVVDRRGRASSGPLTDSYDLGTEVSDAEAVLREFSDVRTLFGWSYGGLIALTVADRIRIPHVVAYEPIMSPFGAEALPALKAADAADDLDRGLEVALTRVSGAPSEIVAGIRDDSALWAGLRRLAAPLYRETQAINDTVNPERFAASTARVDLIIGALNRGLPPYGTSFDDVADRTPHATVHELDGQAHLAHLEAPVQLAALIDRLRPAVI